jgi:hypothetical protein
MFAFLQLFGTFVADLFRPRQQLEVENLFLRHQLNIALRGAPHRLRLRGSDRSAALLHKSEQRCLFYRASHRLPTVVRHFLERRAVAIALRRLRRLRARVDLILAAFMCNSARCQERVCRAQRLAGKIDAAATSIGDRDRTSRI